MCILYIYIVLTCFLVIYILFSIKKIFVLKILLTSVLCLKGSTYGVCVCVCSV